MLPIQQQVHTTVTASIDTERPKKHGEEKGTAIPGRLREAPERHHYHVSR